MENSRGKEIVEYMLKATLANKPDTDFRFYIEESSDLENLENGEMLADLDRARREVGAFADECKKEIESMKNKKISHTHLTYFELLNIKDEFELSLADIQNIKEALDSKSLAIEFPHYFDFLKDNKIDELAQQLKGMTKTLASIDIGDKESKFLLGDAKFIVYENLSKIDAENLIQAAKSERLSSSEDNQISLSTELSTSSEASKNRLSASFFSSQCNYSNSDSEEEAETMISTRYGVYSG